MDPSGSAPSELGALPRLPPALSACEPYYERVRLYLRRFLAYLKPWEARAQGVAGAQPVSASAAPQHVDSFVIGTLVGQGYSDPRALSLRWLDEALLESRSATTSASLVTAAGDPESVASRFESLRASLRLNPAEVDLVWLLLLPELLPELLWVYRAIWADGAQCACPEDFLLHVLDPFGRQPRAGRQALRPGGVLRRLALIESVGTRARSERRQWRAARRLVEHLLGSEPLDECLQLVCAFREHRPGLSPEPALSPERLRPLERILADRLALQSWGDPEQVEAATALHVYGTPGVGKRTLCARLAFAIGRGTVCFDASAWALAELPPLELLVRAQREAYLRRSLLVIHGLDSLAADDNRPLLIALDIALRGQREPLFLVAHERQSILDRLPVRELPCAVPIPGAEVREEIWQGALEGAGAVCDATVTARDLARKYNLAPGGILRSVEQARAQALLSGEAVPRLTHSRVVQAATAQLSHELATVADRVEKTLDWEDLVLPDDCMETLHEIGRRYRHQGRVFDDWGFRAKFAYGTGISVLFSGPPGTGKTMTAGILARELDMELFRIDLSRVVSKWIGETEKNLARVFDEGKASHAIILFDEADSLFGRRGEVRSSVDRYSNLEVNYLLQRMENYEGISILTTNQHQSMDEAFMRRITFKLAFPFPDEKTRRLLWRSMFPSGAHVEPDVPFGVLAEKFEFSGGHIKNAILRAAFLAADAERAIGFKLLLKAAIDEARGMGRLLRVEDLEELAEIERELAPVGGRMGGGRRTHGCSEDEDEDDDAEYEDDDAEYEDAEYEDDDAEYEDDDAEYEDDDAEYEDDDADEDAAAKRRAGGDKRR